MLAERGHIVYGTVRKQTEVRPGINVLTMDLTDQKSVQLAVEQVIQKEGRIDVLINNAGVHTGGAIETTTLENARLQLDTNIMGLVYMLREVLPVMRKQNHGTLINFSSIGGLMGLPFQGFYSASKFAIEGLSEALRMELRQFNIKVVLINPGDSSTLTAGAIEQSNVDLADEFTKMITAQRGFQASARVISTSDEFLQEVVNLKR